MKYLKQYLVLQVIFAAVLIGCGDDEKEKTIEEIQLEKLNATWNVSEVTLDNTSQKSLYNNFKLVLLGDAGATSYGYSTTGRPSNSAWPTSGIWEFGNNPETDMIRDPDPDQDSNNSTDKLDMTYSVSDTQLQISFTFSGTGYPARTSNVKGQWVFTFTK
jgi:hypothetical protein